MDWDLKLTGIVLETESNLEKVRAKLGVSRTSQFGESLRVMIDSHNNLKAISNTAEMNSIAEPRYKALKPAYSTELEPRYNSYGQLLVSNGVRNEPPTTDSQYISPQESNTIISHLNEKVQLQSEIIDELVKTVKELRQERDSDRKEINQLKDSMSELQAQLSSNLINGETRYNDFKEEVRKDLKAIKQQLSSAQKNVSFKSPTNSQTMYKTSTDPSHYDYKSTNYNEHIDLTNYKVDLRAAKRPASPANSDLDISMLTTEPFNTISLPTTGTQPLSDYIFTEDITTDVSATEDLSLDDL